MKSHTSSGQEVTRMKLFFRLRDSITESTNTDFNTRPSREKRPVSMSMRMRVDPAINTST